MTQKGEGNNYVRNVNSMPQVKLVSDKAESEHECDHCSVPARSGGSSGELMWTARES